MGKDELADRMRRSPGYRLGVLNVAGLMWLLALAIVMGLLAAAGLPTKAGFYLALTLIGIAVLSQFVAVLAMGVDARRLGVDYSDFSYGRSLLRHAVRDSARAARFQGLPPK